MKKMYVLEVSAKNISCEVLVNDVVAYEIENVSQVTTQVNASQFLIEGDNTYAINLAKSNKLPSFFECKLLSGERGTQPGDETIEFSYIWDAEKSPLEPVFKNVLEKITFINEPMSSKIWDKSDPVILDVRVKSEILAKLKLLETALASKNIDDILAITKIKHTSTAKSMGVEVTEIEKGFKGFLEMLFLDEKYHVEVLNPDDLAYKVQAKGRLVEVKNTKHKSLINIVASGMPFVIDATFSKIDSAMEIVK